MKHLLLTVVSFFHHSLAVAKPALNTQLLDRTVMQLSLEDESKVVCVYPLNSTK
jgi:hypothetical protein